MSNIANDVEKTPAAAAQPSEPETKSKKAAKGKKRATKNAKPAKKAKAGKKAKPADKKAPAAERSNKKAEVIELMKRAKGATLAEIMELTAWQKHTIRGFVSILGKKGGEKIESSKNAAGSARTRSRSKLTGNRSSKRRPWLAAGAAFLLHVAPISGFK
jgi:outer membrane biosynthesis protein TonB